MEPSVKGGLIIYKNGHHSLSKMATKSIYSKTLKNLLQNQESFEAESLYIVLGTQGLPSLFKW